MNWSATVGKYQPVYIREQIQSVVASVQEAVYHYGGGNIRISGDEKGAVLVTAFGLPPLSHDDDPRRAVRSALMMQKGLARLGLSGSMGITTGRVFCGSVGNERRGEYTMVGSVVNLAARLMGAAKGSIFCDQATCKATEKELVYEHLKQIQLKGLRERIRVAKPTGETRSTLRSKIILVGRGKERALLSHRVQNRLTEVFIYEEDALRCLDSGLRELNTAEPAGQSPEVGRAYAVLSVVLGTVPMHRISRTWSRRALKAVEHSGQPTSIAYVLSRVAVYDLYVAHWDVAVERLRRSVEISRSLGDRRLHEEAMSILAKVLFYNSRYQESRRLWEEVAVSTQYSNCEQTYAWSLLGRGANLLRMGSAASALPLLEESAAWVASKASASEELWMYGLLALTHLRSGDPDKARAVADRILPLAAARPVAYWTQQSAAAVAEVYLTLWSEGKGDVASQAETAVKGCEAFAKVFPFGGAHGQLWRGLLLQLQGKVHKARSTWAQCIQLSERLSTPYERGRAHLEIGRSMPLDDPARRQRLRQAIAALEPLGTLWELQQARQLLGS